MGFGARAALGYLAFEARAGRLRALSNGLAAGFFAAALSPEVKRATTIALYDRLAARPDRALNAWEVAWFAERLPPPPARILVGAAGRGVELTHLRARGYEVEASEPAPAAALRCAELIGASAVLAATYEDWSRAVLDGAGGPARALATRRYDAVLLGWGSLAHVLEPAERVRLVLTCARLTDGPILASYLPRGSARDPIARFHRACDRIGRRLGAAIAQRAADGEAGDTAFVPWGGFVHLCAPSEIEALAAAAGRRVRWEAGDYPHVTFVA